MEQHLFSATHRVWADGGKRVGNLEDDCHGWPSNPNPARAERAKAFHSRPVRPQSWLLVIELTLVRQAAKIIDRSDTELLLGDAERCKDRGLRLMRSDHAPLQRLLLRP